MKRLLILLALIVSAAYSAVVTPGTITDTIYTPFGTETFTGRMVISGPIMSPGSGVTVTKGTKIVNVVNGVFSQVLQPNDTATPAGTYYSVSYRSTAVAETWTETWIVTTSAAALKIRDIRSTSVPAASSAVTLGQLSQTSAETGNVLTWLGSVWGPGNGAGNYSATFTSQTSISVPVSAHGLQTPNLIVTCYDSATPAAEIDCSASVNPTTYAVTIGFATAQSGRYVINGAALGNTPNYAKAFTSATSVAITAAEHNLNVNRLMVACYDAATPANLLDCGATVHPTTFAVAVAFPVAQSGTIVVSGR